MALLQAVMPPSLAPVPRPPPPPTAGRRLHTEGLPPAALAALEEAYARLLGRPGVAQVLDRQTFDLLKLRWLVVGDG